MASECESLKAPLFHFTDDASIDAFLPRAVRVPEKRAEGMGYETLITSSKRRPLFVVGFTCSVFGHGGTSWPKLLTGAP